MNYILFDRRGVGQSSWQERKDEGGTQTIRKRAKRLPPSPFGPSPGPPGCQTDGLGIILEAQMSKRKTCGNCVHGDFNIGHEGCYEGECLVARVLRNALVDMGVPKSIDQHEPIRRRLVDAKESAARCIAYKAKKES